MFLRLLSAELLKLREPLALLSLAGGPGLVGVLAFLGAATLRQDVAWRRILDAVQSGAAILVFPLAVVGFVAFAAQLEHRTRTWDHLLALPVPKWEVFAVKAVVVILAALLLYPLLMALVLLGGALGSLISPRAGFVGAIDLAPRAEALALSAAAGLLLVAVQLWISLRFARFVAPVILGVIGWVGGFVLMGFSALADLARILPWGLPSSVFTAAWARHVAEEAAIPPGAEAPPPVEPLLAVGVAGGAAVLAAMLIDLSRRDLR
jgi:ABC-2 type transport system permease protein